MKSLYQCEVCGNFGEKQVEIQACEKQGTPIFKFSVGEIVVLPFRYPDENGYFGLTKVKSTFVERKTHEPLYELEHHIQTGKRTYSGYAYKADEYTIFGEETYEPAQEYQMYRIGDEYDYTFQGEKHSKIHLEHCYNYLNHEKS